MINFSVRIANELWVSRQPALHRHRNGSITIDCDADRNIWAFVDWEKHRMDQSPQERIAQLERLISSLRHDIRGIITPAALVAEGLRGNADPAVQRSASRIADMVERIVSRLNATHELVPPGGSSRPAIGADGRTKVAGGSERPRTQVIA